MRVPPATAELEAWAKQIREAGSMLLSADAFDRWGPRDDVEQREAIERAAAEAEASRRAAIQTIERRVAELRTTDARALEAWADAHVQLLDDYLGRVAGDSTEAFVAKQERGKWLELRAGACSRVEQNTYYVRYDRSLFEQLFGFPL
jgi:alkanesulfonate monooxygenase SsuD/methylene tetrahydromethanopterin reductase-like flavin-dependent oxidoreductase (luciferase family)